MVLLFRIVKSEFDGCDLILPVPIQRRNEVKL